MPTMLCKTVQMSAVPRILSILMMSFCIAIATRASGAARVYRDHVEPHWFADHTRFWYRNSLRDGASEFVLVNAEAGTRSPAFDHARVAAALSKATNHPTAPDHLPINTLDFESDPGAIIIQDGRKAWRLDAKTYELREMGGAPATTVSLPALSKLHPSRQSNQDTAITFQNHTDEAIAILWVDVNGERHAYATIEPNHEWEQPTFAGHVWLVTTLQGKTLGAYEAIREHATAIVDGKQAVAIPTTQPDAPRPKRRKFAASPADLQRVHRGPTSPDGKWIAFLKDGNLFAREKATGNELQLSADAKPGDHYSLDQLWWSPDGKNLVAMRIEAGQEHKIYTVESSPADQVQPKLRTLDYLKPGDKIDHPRPQLFHVGHAEHVKVKRRFVSQSVEH